MVVDTDVLVSALRKQGGVPRRILRACVAGDYQPLIGAALFGECEELLCPRMEEGFDIVLTPLQFAVILENDSIEESSNWTNRFWGAATVVGGALELVGSAVLLLTPEPTTITKVADGALAAHGADTASTGIMQVVSGRTYTTPRLVADFASMRTYFPTPALPRARGREREGAIRRRA